MILNENATIKNKTVLKKWFFFKVFFTLFKKQILLRHNAQI